MKKLLSILVVLLTLSTLHLKAQEIPPSTTNPNFKQLTTSQFWWLLPSGDLWQYKGSTYGWQRIARYSELTSGLATKADDANTVKRTGNQIIFGEKQFEDVTYFQDNIEAGDVNIEIHTVNANTVSAANGSISNAPTTGNHITNKTYVDGAVAGILSANNTFTGTNTFSNPVTIPPPTANLHATTRKYVDDAIAASSGGAVGTLQLVTDNGNTTTNGASFGGILSTSGKLTWGTGTGSTGIGEIYNTALDGTILIPKAGSTNDFNLTNGAGSTVMDIPTGSLNARFYGSIHSNASILANTFGGYSGGDVSLTTNTSGTSKLIFRTANTDRAVLDGNGNLGIGTSTPTVKLDVVGDLNTSSVYQSLGYSALDGSDGNFLRLNANNDFPSGVYTPGKLRSDGDFTTFGISTLKNDVTVEGFFGTLSDAEIQGTLDVTSDLNVTGNITAANMPVILTVAGSRNFGSIAAGAYVNEVITVNGAVIDDMAISNIVSSNFEGTSVVYTVRVTNSDEVTLTVRNLGITSASVGLQSYKVKVFK